MLIYHNPRCSKSRAGLAYLQEKNLSFQVIDYTKKPFSRQELKELFQKLRKRPFEMIRAQEDLFKTNYKGKDLSDDEWLDALLEYPNLLQRPIVVKGEKAVWAQPPDAIDSL